MIYEISGRIAVRFIGIFELLMLCVYTTMWIKIECCDPDNKDGIRLEKIWGEPKDKRVFKVLNALWVGISFAAAGFLVASSCTRFIAKKRLLTSLIWFVVKVLHFIGYGILGFLSVIGDYELSAGFFGSLFFMFVESVIVYKYMRSLKKIIKAEKGAIYNIDMESSVDEKKANTDKAVMELRPFMDQKMV